MDKVKVKYYGDNGVFYELRIPKNLNWFIISRYFNENNNDYEAVHLIYNGNIIFNSYSYKKNEKIKKIYSKNEEWKIQKVFAHDLLKSLGINSFTLQILDKLQFDINYIKMKYWYIYLNSKVYHLDKNLKCNNKYETYDILYNDANLGRLYINNGNVYIEVNKGNRFDILSLFKAKTNEIGNHKKFLLFK